METRIALEHPFSHLKLGGDSRPQPGLGVWPEMEILVLVLCSGGWVGEQKQREERSGQKRPTHPPLSRNNGNIKCKQSASTIRFTALTKHKVGYWSWNVNCTISHFFMMSSNNVSKFWCAKTGGNKIKHGAQTTQHFRLVSTCTCHIRLKCRTCHVCRRREEAQA